MMDERTVQIEEERTLMIFPHLRELLLLRLIFEGLLWELINHPSWNFHKLAFPSVCCALVLLHRHHHLLTSLCGLFVSLSSCATTSTTCAPRHPKNKSWWCFYEFTFANKRRYFSLPLCKVTRKCKGTTHSSKFFYAVCGFLVQEERPSQKVAGSVKN